MSAVLGRIDSCDVRDAPAIPQIDNCAIDNCAIRGPRMPSPPDTGEMIRRLEDLESRVAHLERIVDAPSLWERLWRRST
jgi:hypothetical protein